jgi:hypothetical protein
VKIAKVWFRESEHLPGLQASAMLQASETIDLDFESGVLKVADRGTVVALVPTGNIRWMQPAAKK